MIVCNEWKTEKRHECTNMGKLKRLELWWQLYVTWLPVRDLENIRPLDFCWTEGYIYSTYLNVKGDTAILMMYWALVKLSKTICYNHWPLYSSKCILYKKQQAWWFNYLCRKGHSDKTTKLLAGIRGGKKFWIIINWTTRYGTAVVCIHRTADGKDDIFLDKLELII